MGVKRPFAEVESSKTVNGFHGEKEQRHRDKKQKVKTLKRKEDNITWVRKRARTIERLFQRDNSKLPANVQNDLERELAAHKQRIEDEDFKKKRSRMIGKYHMVRFFERKKAARMAKQLRKQLEETTDPAEIAALKADLHIAEVDTNYAIYYPFMERYVSLYPVAKEAKESGADEKSLAKLALHSPRPSIWSTIEKTMEQGQAALEKLQNRRPEGDSRSDQPERPLKKAKGKGMGKFDKAALERSRATSGANSAKLSEKGRGTAAAAAAKRKEEGSDSEDGGFFEEG